MHSASIEKPSSEICASNIFEISGTRLEPDIASDIWPKISQHKWLMSEKPGGMWDCGLRASILSKTWIRPLGNILTISERI